MVNSEGGDFDEEDDDGDLNENASDINSPAAPRETATVAAPGTVKENWRTSRERAHEIKKKERKQNTLWTQKGKKLFRRRSRPISEPVHFQNRAVAPSEEETLK